MPKDGTVVANADDANMAYVLQDATIKTLTFGIRSGDLRAEDISYDSEGKAHFKVMYHGKPLTELSLQVPGEFNIYNALGAIGAALSSGISIDAIRKGLETYRGVDKRFQHLYTENGIRVIDDYAHHPGEVTSAIDTVLRMDHRKVHVVFQSHTYTRTRALFDDFVECFDRVDSLTLLPIYAAREPDTGLVSAEELGDAIRMRKTVETKNFETFEEAAKHLATIARTGDIVLTMGAGESVKVAEYLKPLLEKQLL